MSPIEELVREQEVLAARLDNPDENVTDADFSRATEIRDLIEKHNEHARNAREARERLLGAAVTEVRQTGGRPAGMPEAPAGSPAAHGGHDARLGMATRITESEEFKRWVSNGMKGQMAVTIRGPEVRTLLTGTNTTQVQPLPDIVGAQRRPLLISDLLDTKPTDTPLLSYVQDQTSSPQGSPTAVAEGGSKPETSYTFAIVNEVTPTVAHWTQVTRQAVADNRQLQGYLEGQLRYGLDYKLDNDIVNGTGVSPEMTGIFATSGIQTYAPGSAEARYLSVRHARTLARTSYFVPDGVVLNPVDWEIIQTSRASGSGELLLPGAPLVGPDNGTLWGMRVVESDVVASGVALVGAFRTAAQLWQYEEATIYITDSHSDFFIKNILVLLAEQRIGLSVWKPKAFVKVTFNGAG